MRDWVLERTHLSFSDRHVELVTDSNLLQGVSKWCASQKNSVLQQKPLQYNGVCEVEDKKVLI